MEIIIKKPYVKYDNQGTVNKEKSLTRQSHKKECDINFIMSKFQKTGVIQHVKEYGEHYTDVTPTSFHDAMNTVVQAQAMFDELPSSIRSEFKNDTAEFLDFVQNPENKEKMVEMGLVKPERPEKAAEPPATPPATPPAEPPTA